MSKYFKLAYWVKAVTETNINDSIKIFELLDTPKYCVYPCDRDFINTQRIHGGDVCSGIDSILNLVNLNLKYIDFLQLFSIHFICANIKLNYCTL